jgi:hypothetical protein
LSGLHVRDARHRNLGAGRDFERHSVGEETRVHLVHQPRNRVSIIWVAPVHMGSRHHGAYPDGLRGTRERHGVLHRLWAIVNAREYVAVQIDHGYQR